MAASARHMTAADLNNGSRDEVFRFFPRAIAAVAAILFGCGLLMGPAAYAGDGAPAPAATEEQKPAGDAATKPGTGDAKPSDTDATGAKPSADDTKDFTQIPIVLARQLRDKSPPLSLLDLPPADDGVAGGKLAISDNNTTGKFMKQNFTMDVVQSADVAEIVKEVSGRVEKGLHFVIADLDAKVLLQLSDALKDKEVLIINASAPDEELREENCRNNVLHTIPSRTMFADALVQYLAWKNWRNWFLVTGPQPEDKLFADAIKRSAKKFKANIVEERQYTYDPGSRRTDGGFEQVQQQIPSFTQKAPPHDIVMVADEGGLFGEYMPYRTWDARPVAGTAGLTAMTWHPAIELWGGTQFQNRFRRMNGRIMRELDYNVWLAVRAIGESATRTKSGDYKAIRTHMFSPEFELAAFKGIKTTFRDWNGQLRQPILVASAKLLVSVSPQPGYLHQVAETDTLGMDKPESQCKAFKK